MTKARQNRFNSWSELNHDVLLLIMMGVGAVDFFAFSGVCKSWRSLAVLNRHRFMEYVPPMTLSIHPRHSRLLPFRKHRCYLEDSVDGRRTEITLPHSAGRELVGLTCGYFVLYGRKARDFWLLNPITRHGIQFPAFPSLLFDFPGEIRAILVFSPSMSGWVLVVAPRHGYNIWFSVAGKGAWNRCISDKNIIDLHAFRGKIYTITTSGHAYEVRLDPQPKVIILETNNLREEEGFLGWEIISSGEKLYVMGTQEKALRVVELDTAEMKWVKPRNALLATYAYAANHLKHSAIIAPLHCWKGYTHSANFYDMIIRKGGALDLFYFPHDCFRVDILHHHS